MSPPPKGSPLMDATDALGEGRVTAAAAGPGLVDLPVGGSLSPQVVVAAAPDQASLPGGASPPPPTLPPGRWTFIRLSSDGEVTAAAAAGARSIQSIRLWGPAAEATWSDLRVPFRRRAPVSLGPDLPSISSPEGAAAGAEQRGAARQLGPTCPSRAGSAALRSISVPDPLTA